MGDHVRAGKPDRGEALHVRDRVLELVGEEPISLFSPLHERGETCASACVPNGSSWLDDSCSTARVAKTRSGPLADDRKCLWCTALPRGSNRRMVCRELARFA